MATKQKTENKPVEMVCKVSDWDQYLFGQGTHYDIYRKLGAHYVCEKGKDGKEGVVFNVWAPNAARVYNCIIMLLPPSCYGI